MTEDVKSCAAITEEPLEQRTLFIAPKEKAKFIICDMCGYANSEEAAICKKCSNYLEGERK